VGRNGGNLGKSQECPHSFLLPPKLGTCELQQGLCQSPRHPVISSLFGSDFMRGHRVLEEGWMARPRLKCWLPASAHL
jgi:hypothetical protein